MNEYLVIWSPLAEDTYLRTLENILERWSVAEAEDFEGKVKSLLEKLKTHKYLCPSTVKEKSLRRCVITPQTSLVYQIREYVIEIVAFIDNRSNHLYYNK